MIALQAGLAVAGNYAYFNLLVTVLCLPLLDDGFFPYERKAESAAVPHRAGWAVLAVAASLSVCCFVEQYRVTFLSLVQSAIDRAQAFKVSSSYGVFRVMTKTRPEIVVEGSDDGVTWTGYELKWKPGRVDRRPVFVAPWQPRLDWQMWFAAMGHCEPWVQSYLRQLLLGTPQVLALLEDAPAKPPRMLRSTLWQYHFAPSGSPDWWVRTEPAPYCPTVMLDANGRLVAVQ